MNWNEILKIAVRQGFVLVRHGANHDIYRNPTTGEMLTIERHWSQEVRPGLMKALKKKLNF